MSWDGSMLVKNHFTYHLLKHDEAVNGNLCNIPFSDCLYLFNM